MLRFALIPFAAFAAAFCFGAVALWIIAKRTSISQMQTTHGTELRVESRVGSVEVHQEEKLDDRLARIPVYPGAMPINPATAQSVTEAHCGRRTLQDISTGYWTPDSTKQVWEFYRQQLPDWPRNLADARGKELIQAEKDCVLLLRITRQADERTYIEMSVKPPGYPNLFERNRPLESRVRPAVKAP